MKYQINLEFDDPKIKSQILPILESSEISVKIKPKKTHFSSNYSPNLTSSYPKKVNPQSNFSTTKDLSEWTDLTGEINLSKSDNDSPRYHEKTGVKNLRNVFENQSNQKHNSTRRSVSHSRSGFAEIQKFPKKNFGTPSTNQKSRQSTSIRKSRSSRSSRSGFGNSQASFRSEDKQDRKSVSQHHHIHERSSRISNSHGHGRRRSRSSKIIENPIFDDHEPKIRSSRSHGSQGHGHQQIHRRHSRSSRMSRSSKSHNVLEPGQDPKKSLASFMKNHPTSANASPRPFNSHAISNNKHRPVKYPNPSSGLVNVNGELSDFRNGITDVWEISSIGSSCAEENDDVQINFLGMLKNVVCYYGHEIINKIKN